MLDTTGYLQPDFKDACVKLAASKGDVKLASFETVAPIPGVDYLVQIVEDVDFLKRLIVEISQQVDLLLGCKETDKNLRGWDVDFLVQRSARAANAPSPMLAVQQFEAKTLQGLGHIHDYSMNEVVDFWQQGEVEGASSYGVKRALIVSRMLDAIQAAISSLKEVPEGLGDLSQIDKLLTDAKQRVVEITESQLIPSDVSNSGFNVIEGERPDISREYMLKMLGPAYESARDHLKTQFAYPLDRRKMPDKRWPVGQPIRENIAGGFATRGKTRGSLSEQNSHSPGGDLLSAIVPLHISAVWYVMSGKLDKDMAQRRNWSGHGRYTDIVLVDQDPSFRRWTRAGGTGEILQGAWTEGGVVQHLEYAAKKRIEILWELYRVPEKMDVGSWRRQKPDRMSWTSDFLYEMPSLEQVVDLLFADGITDWDRLDFVKLISKFKRPRLVICDVNAHFQPGTEDEANKSKHFSDHGTWKGFDEPKLRGANFQVAVVDNGHYVSYDPYRDERAGEILNNQPIHENTVLEACRRFGAAPFSVVRRMKELGQRLFVGNKPLSIQTLRYRYSSCWKKYYTFDPGWNEPPATSNDLTLEHIVLGNICPEPVQGPTRYEVPMRD